MMRVTETRLMQLAGEATSEARDRIARTQDQLSSGVRVAKASDGVADWVEGHRARVRERFLDAGETALGRTRDRLSRADQVFGGVGDILARSRELAIQARSDSMTADDRKGMAVEIRALRAEALRLVNERAPDGEFLLAGTSGDVAPFDSGGAYVGDAELRSVALDLGLEHVVGTSGARLTAASGVDVFATIDGFIAGLEADDGAALDTAIDDLGAAHDQVADARADVGARLSPLDSAQESLEDVRLVVAQRLADAVDTDPIEAASQFSQDLTALDAARQVASRIFSLLSG